MNIFTDSINDYIIAEELQETHMLYNAVRGLYDLRRSNKEQKAFWNYFWRSWNYVNIKNAFNQAYADMALDPLIRQSKLLSLFRPSFTYNFEKAVAHDQYIFCKRLRNNSYYQEITKPISIPELEAEMIRIVTCDCNAVIKFAVPSKKNKNKRKTFLQKNSEDTESKASSKKTLKNQKSIKGKSSKTMKKKVKTRKITKVESDSCKGKSP